MRAARRVLVSAGVLVGGYAVLGALTDGGRLFGILAFLVAVLVAHDLVLLPAVLGVGALIQRFVPIAARVAVQFGALATLAVTLVALPLVVGAGRVADNPSVLPLPYGRGLAVTVGAVCAAALVVAALHTYRSSRRHDPRPSSDAGRKQLERSAGPEIDG